MLFVPKRERTQSVSSSLSKLRGQRHEKSSLVIHKHLSKETIMYMDCHNTPTTSASLDVSVLGVRSPGNIRWRSSRDLILSNSHCVWVLWRKPMWTSFICIEKLAWGLLLAQAGHASYFEAWRYSSQCSLIFFSTFLWMFRSMKSCWLIQASMICISDWALTHRLLINPLAKRVQTFSGLSCVRLAGRQSMTWWKSSVNVSSCPTSNDGWKENVACGHAGGSQRLSLSLCSTRTPPSISVQYFKNRPFMGYMTSNFWRLCSVGGKIAQIFLPPKRVLTTYCSSEKRLSQILSNAFPHTRAYRDVDQPPIGV